MRAALIDLPWRDPVDAASAFADEPFAMLLLSDGLRARWSYLLRAPERTVLVAADDEADPFDRLSDLAGPHAAIAPDGPPFQGGVAGLASYDLGGRVEPGVLTPHPDWPLLAAGRYLALLAFDHRDRRVVAIGRGQDQPEAEARAKAAGGWLAEPAPAAFKGPLARSVTATSPKDYEVAVAEVVARIVAGEFFQTNIARRWSADLAARARPFDLLVRLARRSPAAFAAYLRLDDLALASNSPERFLSVGPDGVSAASHPIKGTRPRAADAAQDAQLGAELVASAKDRAENLMIVDLMRNDLSRVCLPGTVRAPRLFELETLANVHHLVSVVTGGLRAGLGWPDLLRAAMPPGSITGAPKVEAMKRIAALEPPRGPFFGSLFWAGFDGAFESSVLIRTAAFAQLEGRWRVEARAGAGLVADSDPRAERLETEAKISALLAALTEPAP